jgi:hypothetical protein
MIKQSLKHYCSSGYHNGHGIHSPYLYAFIRKVVFERDWENSPILPSKFCKESLHKKKSAGIILRAILWKNPSSVLEITDDHDLFSDCISYACKLLSEINSKSEEESNPLFFKSFAMSRFASISSSGLREDVLSDEILKEISPEIILINTLNKRVFLEQKMLEYLLDLLHQEAIVLLPEPYTSRDKVEIWNKIKDHPKFSQTIDLFFLGIAIHKAGLQKEHFKVRG